MADVQTEHGFTKIAHEILEAVQQFQFTQNQFKLLIALWRNTYGWNRKECEFSLTFIEKATNLERKRASSTLQSLIEANVITEIEKGSASKTKIVSFNKNYDEWNIKTYKGSVIQATSGHTATSGETTPTTSGQDATTTSGHTATQNIYLKENIKIKDDDKMQQNYFTEYEKAFGYPPSLLISDFEYWIDSAESQFTEPEEIIIEVVHRARKQMPRNPAKYVAKILKDLHDMELYTLDAVKAYNQKFDEKFSNGGVDNGAKVHQYRRGTARPANESQEPIFGDFVGRIPRRKV